MNVLQTEAPSGQVYDLQTTTQGVLQVTLAPTAAGGDGSFTDSGSISVPSLADPVVLVLSNAPPDFVGLVVTGVLQLSWVNNEAESVIASGIVTFEVSLDSGVTYSSIGDPLGYTMQNAVTNPSQQCWATVPFVFRTGTGPATGNVLVRATIADITTGGSPGGGQLVAAGVFTPA